jgi:hypothetical protein
MAIVYAINQSKERNDEPFVIEVTVPDINKLYVDDDYILKKVVEVLGDFYKKITDDENRKFIISITNNPSYYLSNLDNIPTTNSIQKDILSQLKKRYNEVLNTNYVKSMIASQQAVSYRGRIPPKYLKFEKVYTELKESKFTKFSKLLRSV